MTSFSSVDEELAWLRDFFENAPDMFASVDAETGLIKHCNRAVETMLGKPRDQIIGQPVFSVYSEECHDEVIRIFEDFRTNGSAESDQVYLQTLEGKRVPVSVRVSSMRNAEGKIIYSRSIWHDLTLLREVETLRLNRAIQESHRLESLGVLAGGVAHDFNNLLVGILGNASLALTEMHGNSSARQSVEDVVKTAKRAAELTKQMLAYSGKGQVHISRYDLNRLVGEMAQLMEAAISHKVVLRFDLGDSETLIEGDVTQVRQIVMNLITNAADATSDEKGGIVTVRTGRTSVSDELLQQMSHGGNVAGGEFGFIEVSDTGCGMTSDVVDRMFDPFFTTKELGHGLGLAATLGILKAHKGAIRVYSEPGSGTTIRVIIPLSGSSRTPAKKRPQPTMIEEASLALVADDMEYVRTVTKKMLEMLGYEVVLCENGKEAVEMFQRRNQQIELVVLDIIMPEMDGREAFKEIKSIRDDVPVILMSGYSEETITSSVAGRGPVRFIQKPFEAPELELCIRSLKEKDAGLQTKKL